MTISKPVFFTVLSAFTVVILFLAVKAYGPNLSDSEVSSASSVPSSTTTSLSTPVSKKPSTTAPSSGAAGLLNHDVYLSFSDDPSAFPAGTLVTESASVPDVLVCSTDSEACNKGELLIYFVDPINETDSMEGVSVIRSTDEGKTWSERTSISIAGKLNKGPAVDPSVVQLSDGSIRMYYYGPDKPFGGEPAAQEETRNVYSALSTDGVTFAADEGIRLSAVNLTDPEVIQMGSTWFMYYSVGTNSGVASGTDGLTFTDHGEIANQVGGVPGALALEDGVRVYGCSRQGVMSSFAADGIAFPAGSTGVLPSVQQPTCDPSVMPYEDGYVFVYKVVDLSQ